MTVSEPASGLLAGVFAVECADTPAAAFAAAIAADFGATVVIVEPPEGTPLRRLAPSAAQAPWWASLGRNKRSIAIDPGTEDGASTLARLAEKADIVFRDTTSRAAPLAEAARKAVDVELFPTGADRPDLWPWSTRTEFAGAASGIGAITGPLGGLAVQPEMPLADYTAGMMALMLAMGELRAARLAGVKPEPVRLALHEALARMNEWQVIVATAFGRAEKRTGNRFPMNANIGNIFTTRDGQMLSVSAATPAIARRLLTMVGGEALSADPRFATPAARAQHMDELEDLIGDWFARHDGEEALRLVAENDVVVGPIYGAAELMADPHVAARGNIVDVPADGGGCIAMPAALPRTSDGGADVRSTGPTVGQDRDAVLAMLG
ncbi:CoA transferase [Acuticoccus sediminis]|uniref:CoA transferase n=1 Tax=Acuticoccus sediminis TaxID=2184697 RepID=UPI0011B9483C|nr:CoA transferase [Acuticoccus sediminis]